MKKLMALIVFAAVATLTTSANAFFFGMGNRCCDYSYTVNNCDTCSTFMFDNCDSCC